VLARGHGVGVGAVVLAGGERQPRPGDEQQGGVGGVRCGRVGALDEPGGLLGLAALEQGGRQHGHRPRGRAVRAGGQRGAGVGDRVAEAPAAQGDAGAQPGHPRVRLGRTACRGRAAAHGQRELGALQVVA
jgi:hypothetical protein